MILFVNCTPRAESRAQMDARARRMSDSIDHYLDSALNDPLVEISKPGK